jgi:hypothetical protein
MKSISFISITLLHFYGLAGDTGGDDRGSLAYKGSGEEMGSS